MLKENKVKEIITLSVALNPKGRYSLFGCLITGDGAFTLERLLGLSHQESYATLVTWFICNVM